MWQLEVALDILATDNHHLWGQKDKKEEGEEKGSIVSFWFSSREESEYFLYSQGVKPLLLLYSIFFISIQSTIIESFPSELWM